MMATTQESQKAGSYPFQCSFVPGEIIKRGTALSIRCNKKVELEASDAPHSIIVHQQHKQSQSSISVAHEDNCSTFHISTEHLKYGTHSIAIPALPCMDGTTLCDATSIPVTISDIKGNIPSHLRVEHIVHAGLSEYGCKRLKAGSPVPDKCTYIEFVKCVDRKTCQVEQLAFDQSGNQVDGQTLLAAISERRYEEFGNLHPQVKRLCDAKKETMLVDVVIIPRIEECAKEFATWEKDTKNPAVCSYWS